MADKDITVYNEQHVPLVGVEVDCFELTTGNILARATTDLNGIAAFTDLPDDQDWHFRPKATRGGAVGFKELNRPLPQGGARLVLTSEGAFNNVYAFPNTAPFAEIDYSDILGFDVDGNLNPDTNNNLPTLLVYCLIWGGAASQAAPALTTTVTDPLTGLPVADVYTWTLQSHVTFTGSEFPGTSQHSTLDDHTAHVAIWIAPVPSRTVVDVRVAPQFNIIDYPYITTTTDAGPANLGNLATANILFAMSQSGTSLRQLHMDTVTHFNEASFTSSLTSQPLSGSAVIGAAFVFCPSGRKDGLSGDTGLLPEYLDPTMPGSLSQFGDLTTGHSGQPGVQLDGYEDTDFWGPLVQTNFQNPQHATAVYEQLPTGAARRTVEFDLVAGYDATGDGTYLVALLEVPGA